MPPPGFRVHSPSSIKTNDPEAVPLDLEEPIGIAERLAPTAEQHGLELGEGIEISIADSVRGAYRFMNAYSGSVVPYSFFLVEPLVSHRTVASSMFQTGPPSYS
jgi:hypothetical protein